MADPVLSWGRAHRFCHATRPVDRLTRLDVSNERGPVLAHGQGRSYGDVALNDGGALLTTPDHDRFLAADWTSGVLRASSGVTLDGILKLSVPKGWFLPVTPGSKYVSLGGAVANDVHGKNHHKVGSFGAHIRSLCLLRSDREALVCSRDENADLFALTIGGLGLTGFIDWVEIQLSPIASSDLVVETHRVRDVSHFLELSEAYSDRPYTVAWVDCFAPRSKAGRGLFTIGRFADTGPLVCHKPGPKRSVPFTPPGFLLNRMTISAFNALYRIRPGSRFRGRQPYDPFFYPLDAIGKWNRLYGPNGFFQHQCILPPPAAHAGLTALFDAIRTSGQGSFLAVLKQHGPETSPGIMSFGREGVSLALDFRNAGEKTLALLHRLDAVVRDHGGVTYPAKDGHMSSETFQAFYPQWERLEAARDPAFSSSFWRRVTASH